MTDLLSNVHWTSVFCAVGIVAVAYVALRVLTGKSIL
jgi:hypothetical protein